MNILKKYGVTEEIIKESTQFENLKIGRVIAQYRGLYKIVTNDGECLGEISGKLRHLTDELAKFPAVGDFVMVDYQQGEDRCIVHHILNRKSVFLRTAIGVTGQAQVVAANIDTVFICMSLNNNYNLNRLERYLSIAWDCGATPVILLTKADLCEDLQRIVEEVETIAPFSPIITLSMYDENITDKLEEYLQEGMTVAFIGSSGVGKTTLINSIIGEEMRKTKAVDKADKGRHTTTGREMFICPLGGVVIDTPGMRELGAESVDLSKTFVDIEELSKNCKFHNCTHTSEHGCALQKALEDGIIDERRLESYFKLQRETGYSGLNSKEIEAKKLDRMFKDIGGMKNARKAIKEIKKRK